MDSFQKSAAFSFSSFVFHRDSQTRPFKEHVSFSGRYTSLMHFYFRSRYPRVFQRFLVARNAIYIAIPLWRFPTLATLDRAYFTISVSYVSLVMYILQRTTSNFNTFRYSNFAYPNFGIVVFLRLYGIFVHVTYNRKVLLREIRCKNYRV